jgi:flagella basal body P-ring formation protein FlgA
MRMQWPKTVAILSIVVIASVFDCSTVFAVEKAHTTHEELVTAGLRAYVADGLQIDSAAVTIRILSPLDGKPFRKAIPISHLGSGSPVGRVTFLMGTARVHAQVEALKEVVVASRFLRRNQLMEEGDLVMTPVRLISPTGRYIDQLNLAIGKRVTRSISARLPVTEDALGKPYMIRQGARISIQYLQGPLKVLALGSAKEDGLAGASIRVTNLDSKKELWARVVDGETVQVGP